MSEHRALALVRPGEGAVQQGKFQQCHVMNRSVESASARIIEVLSIFLCRVSNEVKISDEKLSTRD
jgi:hypothetical protein